MNQIDELLNTPYWVIDILPAQVPKDSPGQYFTIEDYLLKNRIAEIKQKHIDIILKLNCYRDISIEEELNPPPEKISGIMRERYVYIMVGNSMILSEPDDTHLTLFNPDEELLDLIYRFMGNAAACPDCFYRNGKERLKLWLELKAEEE